MKVRLKVWIEGDKTYQSVVDLSEVMAILRTMKKYSLPVKFMVEPLNDEEQDNGKV